MVVYYLTHYALFLLFPAMSGVVLISRDDSVEKALMSQPAKPGISKGGIPERQQCSPWGLSAQGRGSVTPTVAGVVGMLSSRCRCSLGAAVQQAAPLLHHRQNSVAEQPAGQRVR